MTQDKDSLVVIHQHPFIPNQNDFYQLFLSTMSLNQVRRDVQITSRGYQHAFTSEKLTLIHDSFPNTMAKLNLWCNAQYIINPSCMIDDKLLIMRRGDTLNLIDYTQDRVEAALLLNDVNCSDFGEIDPQLNNPRIQNQLRTDIITISPQGNMFCLFDPINRIIYGGGIKPFSLLFRFKVPLSNEDDFVHMLPADNMTAFIVPGHGLQSYYLKPMDLRTYICMRWSLTDTFKSTISSPASITRINDSVCYIPVNTFNRENDTIVVDTYNRDVATNRISLKKRIERRKCFTKMDCSLEEEDYLRPRKKFKTFEEGAIDPTITHVEYRSIGLIHNGSHLYCIQEPVQVGMEILRIVNVDDGTSLSIGASSSLGSITAIGSPKKIIQSPNRNVTLSGKRKRSLIE